VIDQQSHFRCLANHGFLDFRFRFVRVKRPALHIEAFAAHYHNINMITTDNFLSDPPLQRQRILIQFSAGRNNVYFRLRQLMKCFRRVG
jgi:hypothetical protein